MFVETELAKSRRRPAEANHERLIEAQILDALLRIEELLQPKEEPVVEGELADVIVDVKPVETPFQKAIAAKPKSTRKVDRL